MLRRNMTQNDTTNHAMDHDKGLATSKNLRKNIVAVSFFGYTLYNYLNTKFLGYF